MKAIIIVGICALLLGCGNTLDKDCGMKYNIDDCNFAKCMYENSEDYTPKYRAMLLNNYYECQTKENEIKELP